MNDDHDSDAPFLTALHEVIARSKTERVDFLRRLVQIDSTTGSEEAIQQELIRFLRHRGFAVQALPVDLNAVMRRAPTGMGKPKIGGPNVLGTLSGDGGGRSLLLNGHCDVVPAGNLEHWANEPFGGEIRDGKMWGRGTADMKAGIAASIFAMIAIRELGIRLRGDVAFLSTVGEEEGSPGALAFADGCPTYDAAIVAEPTQLRIVPAHAGSTHVSIHFRGKGTHASLRESGVSAIEKFCEFARTLPEFENQRNRALSDELYREIPNKVPVSVGIVRGGHAAAAVPEELTCVIRIGILASENFEDAKRQFEEHVRDWAAGDSWMRENPPVIDWSGPQIPGSQIAIDSPIVTTLERTLKDVGVPVSVRGMTGGTDMVHLVNAGIPTVVFGPGDLTDAHRADEHVSLHEFDLATLVFAETILRWCGVEDAGDVPR